MKQHISVRAIVRQDSKTLLLKRANGRASIMGLYELPGGKLAYKEQPEDALRRYLHDDAGIHIQTAQLYDAVTYIDHDDRDIQYAVIVYLVSVASGHHAMNLSNNYSRYSWKRNADIDVSSITDLTQLLLGIVEHDSAVSVQSDAQSPEPTASSSGFDAIVYSDGGSRGNPGPSASGYVILNSKQEVIDQGGVYLGVTTNNVAEYQGVLVGLERAKQLGLKRIDFRIDSMLVVNQMNGIYKVKNRELWPIHERIRGLMSDFDRVRFTHVRREFNQLADTMVNRTLDDRK